MNDNEFAQIAGASKLRVDFDKGINTFSSEGGEFSDVLAQAKSIVSILSQSNIKFFIEVCDDEWKEIITFGDYCRN